MLNNSRIDQVIALANDLHQRLDALGIQHAAFGSLALLDTPAEREPGDLDVIVPFLDNDQFLLTMSDIADWADDSNQGFTNDSLQQSWEEWEAFPVSFSKRGVQVDVFCMQVGRDPFVDLRESSRTQMPLVSLAMIIDDKRRSARPKDLHDLSLLL